MLQFILILVLLAAHFATRIRAIMLPEIGTSAKSNGPSDYSPGVARLFRATSKAMLPTVVSTLLLQPAVTKKLPTDMCSVQKCWSFIHPSAAEAMPRGTAVHQITGRSVSVEPEMQTFEDSSRRMPSRTWARLIYGGVTTELRQYLPSMLVARSTLRDILRSTCGGRNLVHGVMQEHVSVSRLWGLSCAVPRGGASCAASFPRTPGSSCHATSCAA